ncbi:MAG: DUF1343 domain-containing protein [Desulfobacteraceae bacterium]|nr:MAG: DUF1343 domain-containing protein [Desulfobacteraceae bacterium]
MAKIATGLDQFEEEFWKRFKGQSLGLLANQASVDHNLKNAKYAISTLLPGDLKILFGPQHGFRGEDQDNMVETEDYFDPELHIPVFSLYRNKMDRLSDILDNIDLLIIDLQDVGTRVYTFISTMLYCLKEVAKSGKRVLILDRPNPLGGIIVEGNLLRPEFYSLVGPFTLPMRHGMTIGELAYLFNDAFKIDCDITVVPLKGWHRQMLWEDTGLRWIMPSPNMPLLETALVYPGQVIWEGTNISEGRGTCRPFEIFGAPFINPFIIKKGLASKDIEGCYLQEYCFRPTFNKWKAKLCGGFMIHVLNPNIFRPYQTSLALLRIIIETYQDKFAWQKPPYEYEFTRLPIDLIFGDSSIRLALEAGKDIEELLEGYSKELEGFLESRKPYLIY